MALGYSESKLFALSFSLGQSVWTSFLAVLPPSHHRAQPVFVPRTVNLSLIKSSFRF